MVGSFTAFPHTNLNKVESYTKVEEIIFLGTNFALFYLHPLLLMTRIGSRLSLEKVEFNEAIATTENGPKPYNDPTIATGNSVVTTLDA